MAKRLDLLCLGELLIDFVCPDLDVPLSAAARFHRAPGGAPANVAVGAARLGLASGFIGCVGDDPFGAYLSEVVAAAGVDVSGLRRTGEARTTLAFIASRADGRKDIAFWRNPGADTCLRPDDLDREALRCARAFHFCSVSLSREPIRSATLEAARTARAAGRIVSFDPNWRAPLWDDPAEGRRWIGEGLALADVVKVAEEELEVVCGTTDLAVGLRRLLEAGARLAVVTCGERGCHGATRAGSVAVPGFAVDVVDPLGAGDAFVAALLARLLAGGELEPGGSELRDLLAWANAAGALATQAVGVIPALPSADQVASFLAAEAKV